MDLYLIELTQRTTGPQKWDEGPNDTKYFYSETTHEIISGLDKTMKRYNEIKYFESIKLYKCEQIVSKVNK